MRSKNIAFLIVFLFIAAWGSYELLLNPAKKQIVVAPTPSPEANSTVTSPSEKSTEVNTPIIENNSTDWMSKTTKAIEAQASNLNTEVIKASLKAYQKAEKLGLNKKPILTIVDYTLPSTDRRLWVIDMTDMKVLFNTWVAHGKNSGGATPNSFSNTPSSLKSSVGVFITDAPYTGGKGYSLRIKGLENNINSNAYNRSIVFHGAWYVSSSFAKARGMMGRSFGCFAVDNKIVKSLINTIKEKSLVVAYYPDKKWLQQSSFIN